jgi:hypothetical protein
MSACKTFSHQQVHQLLDEVLGPGLHAKRIASLADATLGVMHTASLAVCTIGHGLAMARGLNARHAVKQVDRMLSNPGIDVDQILALWVPFVIGARTSLLVAMDWTDFDADNQATIMLSLITEHGRATPLVWLTVDKAELKDRRSLYERRALVRLAEIVPAGGWRLPRRRSRLRRSEPLPAADRGVALRLRHTLPRQYQGDGCQRRHPHRRGLGEPERAGACAARGDGDSGSLSGWHRGLRARS